MVANGKKVAFVFPGQGTQFVGMGADLCAQFASAREIFDRADEALCFSVSKLCFEGPEAELKKTVNSQPAILTVSLACLAAAKEAGRVDSVPPPAFMAGHSLGEYTALVASGSLTLEEGVRLVRERGRLMQEASDRTPSGMVALLGVTPEQVEEVCRETGVQMGNINSPDQIAISGPLEPLRKAAALALAKGARKAVLLEVSGAFHSEVMRPSQEGLAVVMATMSFQPLGVPVVANGNARPITTPGEAASELLFQLCHPVLWKDSVEFMVGEGVASFVEIGPGKVLTGLIKRAYRDADTANWNDASSITAR